MFVLTLSSVEEIQQMSELFQQKQRDLLLAVSRVEELRQQLEALRSSSLQPPAPSCHHSTSTAELERLFRELQVRPPWRLRMLPAALTPPSVTSS